MNPTKLQLLSTAAVNVTALDASLLQEVELDIIPFISTAAINTAELSSQIQDLSHQKIAVVFTSAAAVAAVTSCLTILPDWELLCINGKTQRAVEQYFGASAITFSATHASALAEQIIASEKYKEVIFFCNALRLHELPNQLQAAGIAITELFVYQTISTPVKISKAYQAILFYSPSMVDSFFAINTIDKEAVLFAIGQTTAASIQQHCSNPIIISEKADKEWMLEQALIYFNKNS